MPQPLIPQQSTGSVLISTQQLSGTETATAPIHSAGSVMISNHLPSLSPQLIGQLTTADSNTTALITTPSLVIGQTTASSTATSVTTAVQQQQQQQQQTTIDSCQRIGHIIPKSEKTDPDLVATDLSCHNNGTNITDNVNNVNSTANNNDISSSTNTQLNINCDTSSILPSITGRRSQVCIYILLFNW